MVIVKASGGRRGYFGKLLKHILERSVHFFIFLIQGPEHIDISSY